MYTHDRIDVLAGALLQEPERYYSPQLEEASTQAIICGDFASASAIYSQMAQEAEDQQDPIAATAHSKMASFLLDRQAEEVSNIFPLPKNVRALSANEVERKFGWSTAKQISIDGLSEGLRESEFILRNPYINLDEWEVCMAEFFNTGLTALSNTYAEDHEIASAIKTLDFAIWSSEWRYKKEGLLTKSLAKDLAQLRNHIHSQKVALLQPELLAA